MVKDNMVHQDEDSPIDDIAYLARSHHRILALVAMTECPRSRSELCEMTGRSSSTIRRALEELEDRSWIRQDGYQYETTQLGEAIASGMGELINRVETERKLRDVYQWLPDDMIELAIERSAKTTVTVAEPGAPHRPVNRFKSLLQEADQFRFVGVDAGLYVPCKREFEQRVLDGMEAEIIDQPSVARNMLSTYPDRCSTLLDSGHLTVFIHDDLPPYGVSLFDDRVAISGYDLDSGGTKVLIDTAMQEAQEWGQSVFGSYKCNARPLEPRQVVSSANSS